MLRKKLKTTNKQKHCTVGTIEILLKMALNTITLTLQCTKLLNPPFTIRIRRVFKYQNNIWKIPR